MDTDFTKVNYKTESDFIKTMDLRLFKTVYFLSDENIRHEVRLQQRFVCEESGAEEWLDVQIVEQ
jgi:hypothetical protein